MRKWLSRKATIRRKKHWRRAMRKLLRGKSHNGWTVVDDQGAPLESTSNSSQLVNLRPSSNGAEEREEADHLSTASMEGSIELARVGDSDGASIKTANEPSDRLQEEGELNPLAEGEDTVEVAAPASESLRRLRNSLEPADEDPRDDTLHLFGPSRGRSMTTASIDNSDFSNLFAKKAEVQPRAKGGRELIGIDKKEPTSRESSRERSNIGSSQRADTINLSSQDSDGRYPKRERRTMVDVIKEQSEKDSRVSEKDSSVQPRKSNSSDNKEKSFTDYTTGNKAYSKLIKLGYGKPVKKRYRKRRQDDPDPEVVDYKVDKEVATRSKEGHKVWDLQWVKEGYRVTGYNIDWIVACANRKVGKGLPKDVLIKYTKYPIPSWEKREKIDDETDNAAEQFLARCLGLDFVEVHLRTQHGDEKFDELYPYRYHEPEQGVGTGGYITHKRTLYINQLRATESKWNVRCDLAGIPHIYIEDWTREKNDDKALAQLEFINYLCYSAYVMGLMKKFKQLENMKCDSSCKTCSLEYRTKEIKHCCYMKISVEIDTSKGHFEWRDEGKATEFNHDIHIECTDKCGCPRGCRNRVSQRGRQMELCVFREAGKGWGVRTLNEIPVDTFITEYTGEMNTTGAKENWKKVYDFDTIFPLVDSEGKQLLKNLVISSGDKGNESRFFNHSCNPNMKSEASVVERNSIAFHHLSFFARRKIAAGEELTFNYFPQKTKADDETKSMFGGYCKCGTPICFLGPEKTKSTKGEEDKKEDEKENEEREAEEGDENEERDGEEQEDRMSVDLYEEEEEVADCGGMELRLHSRSYDEFLQENDVFALDSPVRSMRSTSIVRVDQRKNRRGVRAKVKKEAMSDEEEREREENEERMYVDLDEEEEVADCGGMEQTLHYRSYMDLMDENDLLELASPAASSRSSRSSSVVFLEEQMGNRREEEEEVMSDEEEREEEEEEEENGVEESEEREEEGGKGVEEDDMESEEMEKNEGRKTGEEEDEKEEEKEEEKDDDSENTMKEDDKEKDEEMKTVEEEGNNEEKNDEEEGEKMKEDQRENEEKEEDEGKSAESKDEEDKEKEEKSIEEVDKDKEEQEKDEGRNTGEEEGKNEEKEEEGDASRKRRHESPDDEETKSKKVKEDDKEKEEKDEEMKTGEEDSKNEEKKDERENGEKEKDEDKSTKRRHTSPDGEETESKRAKEDENEEGKNMKDDDKKDEEMEKDGDKSPDDEEKKVKRTEEEEKAAEKRREARAAFSGTGHKSHGASLSTMSRSGQVVTRVDEMTEMARRLDPRRSLSPSSDKSGDLLPSQTPPTSDRRSTEYKEKSEDSVLNDDGGGKEMNRGKVSTYRQRCRSMDVDFPYIGKYDDDDDDDDSSVDRMLQSRRSV